MRNKRFKQADREAFIALGVYGFFFLWWTLFAFGLGSGDPEHYNYVLGMPAWFFYSCILGYLVVTVLLWIVIKVSFSDMPLDASLDTSKDNPSPKSVLSGTSVSGNEPKSIIKTEEKH